MIRRLGPLSAIGLVLLFGCGETGNSKADSIEQTLLDAQKNNAAKPAEPWKPRTAAAKGPAPKDVH